MIKITAVLVSPLKPVLIQNFSEPIKDDCVIGSDRVVSNGQFQCHRDEREADNESGPQIASGAHVSGSSSFSACVSLPAVNHE